MGRESVAVVSSPPTATVRDTDVAATALAPGFRFHPTDEELVSYYLKRKVLGIPIRFDAIGEVDIYKHEPWDLAVFSRLKTRDQEWNFYSALDKKYGNGARMNRATNKGYWKATGKDREIRRDIIQLIGLKKTLVFHSGRAPDGLRTNWVMHEYRLVDYEIENNGNLVQDAYVLCRVFHKNNIGPPSGNRYAPFMEEEWADDGAALIPGVDVRVRAEPLPLANNQMDQEIKSASKEFININEPPRETTPMNIELNHQNHHENAAKPQENNSNNQYDEDEEALKREHADEDGRPPPLRILKESPLPLLQYKRRRQNESNNNSSRTTQDHCSSTTTTVDNTTALISSTAAATNTAISALLEFSLMGISDKKENPQTLHMEPSPPTPLLSPGEKLNDLQKKIHQMSVESKTFKPELMSAEAMISILQSRIDALRQENDELKKSSANAQ